MSRHLIGGFAPPERGPGKMQRTDGSYLYNLGSNLHPLKSVDVGDTYAMAYPALIWGEQGLDALLHQSIYKLRHSLQSGETLLSWIRFIKDKAIRSADFATEEVAVSDATGLRTSLANFETNLASEFGLMPTYLVAKKGGYDTADLIENGRALFQSALPSKVPDSVRDIEQATRCIAFEVPTAAGFHLHRANESVLHKYFDAVCGDVHPPKERNMGAYLAVMEKHELGDRRVRSALKDIKDLHRNPLIHPEHSLESVEEAIDLLGAIRAAIGAMLPAIPEPDEPPSPEFAALLEDIFKAQPLPSEGEVEDSGKP